MSKNKGSIAKMEKMMNELHIDDETCASFQLISPMTFENQFFNKFPHQQQNRQRDRARFFYQLRQKRKHRRLQQGPLRIHHHQQHKKQMKNHNLELKRENKLVTGIVGSSIARHISIQNIENNNDELRLRYKSGSDCAEALFWLKTTDGLRFMHNVNQLIFILGTNDINRVGAIQTVRHIGSTIEAVRHLYPGVNIAWQLLQQRTKKTWLLPEGQLVINEIDKCNVLLLELAVTERFDTIQPGIPIEHMYDGLHPSMHGVHMMETTIRNYLKHKKMAYSFSSSNPPPLMSIKF